MRFFVDFEMRGNSSMPVAWVFMEHFFDPDFQGPVFGRQLGRVVNCRTGNP
jgi:hypothetical protein